MNLHSCIYEGQVRHRRFQPVLNQFCYRVFLMFLDLEELPDFFSGRRLWSADRVNLAYFRRRDHLGDPRLPLDRAGERIQTAGLAYRVTLLLRDYRHLEGVYDKLVSIEMIEAVGYEDFDAFFRVCSERLKENGLMCLQAITIADQVFDRFRRSHDFIRSHVFPGSCLTSMAAITASLAEVTDLRLIHLEDIIPHYPKTPRLWRQRFFDNLPRVRALGYPETLIRLWEFYLCYCEGGFMEEYIGDKQLLLAKPGYRQAIEPPSCHLG